VQQPGSVDVYTDVPFVLPPFVSSQQFYFNFGAQVVPGAFIEGDINFVATPVQLAGPFAGVLSHDAVTQLRTLTVAPDPGWAPNQWRGKWLFGAGVFDQCQIASSTHNTLEMTEINDFTGPYTIDDIGGEIKAIDTASNFNEALDCGGVLAGVTTTWIQVTGALEGVSFTPAALVPSPRFYAVGTRIKGSFKQINGNLAGSLSVGNTLEQCHVQASQLGSSFEVQAGSLSFIGFLDGTAFPLEIAVPNFQGAGNIGSDWESFIADGCNSIGGSKGGYGPPWGNLTLQYFVFRNGGQDGIVLSEGQRWTVSAGDVSSCAGSGIKIEGGMVDLGGGLVKSTTPSTRYGVEMTDGRCRNHAAGMTIAGLLGQLKVGSLNVETWAAADAAVNTPDFAGASATGARQFLLAP